MCRCATQCLIKVLMMTFDKTIGEKVEQRIKVNDFINPQLCLSIVRRVLELE